MLRTKLDGSQEEVEVMLGAGVYSSAQGLEKYNIVAQAKRFLVDCRRLKIWHAMGEQEDAVRWVAEFLYPESFKSAPKNHALREDRAWFVLEKQRHFDAIKQLRKGALNIPEHAEMENVQAELNTYMQAIQQLREGRCVLRECVPLQGNLTKISSDSTHACIDDLRTLGHTGY